MPKQPKKRKPGRPKLAEHETKGKIVPVRFTESEYDRVSEAARKADKTVSQWVRSILSAAIEG